MAFHMPTQSDAYAEQHQNAVPAQTFGPFHVGDQQVHNTPSNFSNGPTQTFGLFHVGDQQVYNTPSNFSNGPLGTTDPLSGILNRLTLDDFTPQVPAQPQQELAVKEAEHADTQDNEFGSITLSPVEVRKYRRGLQRFFRKCVHQPYTVEGQAGYPNGH
ncbi:hypothetical protein FS749_012705 [Ceratobasidium sp. UAMH 11750]|nr:hypothetical protein FS749_012705 [Ceratobasidium sp. UAMH 11750]